MESMATSPAGSPLEILQGDNLPILQSLEAASFQLVYIDPPFNTGKNQSRTRLKTVRDDAGDRTGFGGARYKSVALGSLSFADAYDDYLAFLEPRLREAWRLLSDTGSLFLHVDCREVHYVKVLMDALFGRDHFLNEIIWAYDFGGRSKKRWSAKHDNLLWYVKDPKNYTFHFDEMDRIPYMAPGLVTPEKAARGKTPTDVWWHTIVPTNGAERTGYPTQKPLGVVERIVKVHSSPGDRLLDFFAGSGTLGEAALAGARSVGFCSAGTVEFLVDEDQNFYFLEMNTRIQVEHPVSEMVSGLDLIKEQIRIAAGEKLGFQQRGVNFDGHSIECRINAEDPDTFVPSPGVIETFSFLGGPGIRLDTYAHAGCTVSPFYDSLVAKVVAHGRDRNEAIARLRRTLDMTVIEGIKTNIPLHQAILEDPGFVAAEFDTTFLERFQANRPRKGLAKAV